MSPRELLKQFEEILAAISEVRLGYSTFSDPEPMFACCKGWIALVISIFHSLSFGFFISMASTHDSISEFLWRIISGVMVLIYYLIFTFGI